MDWYLRVEGEAIFNNCEVGDGGKSSPGPGGAIFVDESGVVVFNGGVQITDVSILDDEGSNGGGIYNKGTVNVKGSSKFERNWAETAGAIYNDEGAFFRFKKGATAVFSECASFDGLASSIFNAGYFEFSGAALFLESKSESRGGAMAVSPTGETILSTDSVFFQVESKGDIGASVYVFEGGSVKIPESLPFVATGEDDGVCGTIYFEDGEECV